MFPFYGNMGCMCIKCSHLYKERLSLPTTQSRERNMSFIPSISFHSHQRTCCATCCYLSTYQSTLAEEPLYLAGNWGCACVIAARIDATKYSLLPRERGVERAPLTMSSLREVATLNCNLEADIVLLSSLTSLPSLIHILILTFSPSVLLKKFAYVLPGSVVVSGYF